VIECNDYNNISTLLASNLLQIGATKAKNCETLVLEHKLIPDSL
jgi:hypothetical protein